MKMLTSKTILYLFLILAFLASSSLMGCEGENTEINLYLGEGGIGDDDAGDDDDDDDDNGDDDDDSDDDDDDDDDASEFDILVTAANDYLSQELSPVFAPADLFTLLNDGDDTNDPFILDIRSATDYETAGHIAGAVHIDFRAVPDNLDLLPTDDTIIVVYCYTGHTASQITMFLNMLGYETYALKFGMMGWNDEAMGDGKLPFDYTTVPDYTVESGSNELSDTYDLPSVDTGESSAADVIAAAAANYLTQELSPVFAPADLYANLNDGDDTNNPFVLDLRSLEDFESATYGHIPTGYNMGYRAVADSSMLEYLPLDKQIIVCCYTGHTASQITMFLNMLGYEAYASKFGMMGWNDDAMGDGKAPFDYTTVPDYPVETGS